VAIATSTLRSCCAPARHTGCWKRESNQSAGLPCGTPRSGVFVFLSPAAEHGGPGGASAGSPRSCIGVPWCRSRLPVRHSPSVFTSGSAVTSRATADGAIDFFILFNTFFPDSFQQQQIRAYRLRPETLTPMNQCKHGSRAPSSHARKRRANRCPCTARTYSISHAHPPSRETPTACQVARRFTEAHFRGDPQQIGRDVGSAPGREAAQKQQRRPITAAATPPKRAPACRPP